MLTGLCCITLLEYECVTTHFFFRNSSDLQNFVRMDEKNITLSLRNFQDRLTRINFKKLQIPLLCYFTSVHKYQSYYVENVILK